MNKLYIILFSFLLAGCYKYEALPDIPNSAYLRVYNSIPNTLNAVNSGQTTPYLCMLIDPVFDKEAIPVDGAIVGDFLKPRNLYSVSYAADAGTDLNAGNGNITPGGSTPNIVTNTNYEYPGKLHVRTAPAINGYDLSAWAQVPSGKHRIMFVSRPDDNTPFSALTSTLRRRIIIDTTITLDAGEVYTMHALTTDLDNAQYGAYVRKEQFIHQQSDPARHYVSFYNLSGAPSFSTKNPAFPNARFYKDTQRISYTYLYYSDDEYDVNNSLNFSPPAYPMPEYREQYLTTINRKGSSEVASLVPLPFLPRSSFFDSKGFLRKFDRQVKGLVYGLRGGTLPFVKFDFSGGPSLLCTADPAIFNNFVPDKVNNSLSPYYLYQSNTNLIISSAGNVNIYPTLNIFEIIYNRVYMIQIQRRFEKVPKN